MDGFVTTRPQFEVTGDTVRINIDHPDADMSLQMSRATAMDFAFRLMTVANQPGDTA